MDKTGTLFTIAWLGHTDPPEGAPRILCEYFQLGKRNGLPVELANFPVSLGGGYMITSQHVSKPGVEFSVEALASIRKKRIARKITAKVPLFADHFIDEQISRNPDYFAGITDAKLKAASDRAHEQEAKRYSELMARPNVLVVYAQEPEACRQRAARLRAEMDEVKRKAAERRMVTI
jgi:hypothetical protein